MRHASPRACIKVGIDEEGRDDASNFDSGAPLVRAHAADLQERGQGVRHTTAVDWEWGGGDGARGAR
jgi:hypothetical protein